MRFPQHADAAIHEGGDRERPGCRGVSSEFMTSRPGIPQPGGPASEVPVWPALSPVLGEEPGLFGVPNPLA